MRAVIQSRYGDIDDLVIEDAPVPIPEDDEVLIRVHAASVHPDVWHVVAGKPHVLRLLGNGFRRPRRRIPGTDVSGVVVDTGKDVTDLEPGDAVYGEVITGIQWVNGGSYAEYVAAPTDAIRRAPADLGHAQASTIGTAGLITVENLGGGEFVWPDQRVLVNGAGGGVGMMAAQIAVGAGARVTAVDAEPKARMLHDLGAERFIDYRDQDYTRLAERFDLVFDVVGNRPPSQVRRIVEPDGRYVLIGHDHFGKAGHRVLGSITRFALITAMSAWVKPFRATGRPKMTRSERMDVLASLVDRGVVRPPVGHTYPLEDVSEALRFLTTGEAVGRIVLTVEHVGAAER